jgi:hypothetical protein
MNIIRQVLLIVVLSIAVGAAVVAKEDTLPADGKTSITIGGQQYGASRDDLGPIGGGQGYTRVIADGDYEVTTLDGLLEALSKAKSGEVVFIPGETTIDCTARVYIESLVIEVPGGVTLAGNRGDKHSAGALICSDALKTSVLIRATGPDVRITGLRIRGPNPKRCIEHHRRSFSQGRGREYYYKFPTSDGISTRSPQLEVDNCEISGFSHAAIYLIEGDGHHVHHCHIHHCQYQGLGYGVCHNVASSLIERNLFDWNRHSIAGTGRPGCNYEARHNVVGSTSSSHCFDMHGGRDRKDGTKIAGTQISIHHNTFRSAATPVVIRGTPQEYCRVTNNWFVPQDRPSAAVRASDRTYVENNAYGLKSPTTQPAIR